MAPIRRLVLIASAFIPLLAVLAGVATDGALAHAPAPVAQDAHAVSCAGPAHGAGRRLGGRAAARARACAKARREAERRREAARRRARERRRARKLEREHAERERLARVQASASGAAGTGACEGASVRPSETDLQVAVGATLCLINRERAAHGEPALREDGDLERAAEGHSQSMAQQGYFEHDDPNGQTPLSRIAASGYLGNAGGYELGENIAWGSLSQGTPEAIVAAWMSSPPHRANILNAGFRDSGIGICAHLPAAFGAGALGAIYTQDFGATAAG